MVPQYALNKMETTDSREVRISADTVHLITHNTETCPHSTTNFPQQSKSPTSHVSSQGEPKSSSSKAYCPDNYSARLFPINIRSGLFCNHYSRSSLVLRSIHSGLVLFREVLVLFKLHLLAVFRIWCDGACGAVALSFLQSCQRHG